jgi:hypothetical protein
MPMKSGFTWSAIEWADSERRKLPPEYPGVSAGILPIFGAGSQRGAKTPAGVPICAFHVDCDNYVPLSESRKIVDAVRSAGGKRQLTVIPDEGHNICNFSMRPRGEVDVVLGSASISLEIRRSLLSFYGWNRRVGLYTATTCGLGR